MSRELFDQHRQVLDDAVNAIHARRNYSAFPEIPSGKIYGESARDDGQAAFKQRLGKPFDMTLPGDVGWVGSEKSPYGIDLGITYPKVDLKALLPAIEEARKPWRDADPETRVGIALEILRRLNTRSFELANAVMHTTGQGFMMAFQAGGPHAQDRALEAIAYAWNAMNDCPREVSWEKRVSKTDTITLNKTFRIVPRGIAVTVACSTFPTWNGYPGIFASFVTGNAVIVKPHPGAILPLAMTVELMREVLVENDFDPNIVTLVADTVDEPVTKDLVTRSEVGIIDYTGSSEFGTWIEQNARQAVVFTEKAGVNTMVIDSIEDLKAATANIAFTLCLYAGQMCTATQNIFIPADGIEIGAPGSGERMSFNDVAKAIVKAVNWMTSDPARAAEMLGAIQNPATVRRIQQATKDGAEVLRPSDRIESEQFPDARIHSPLLLRTSAANSDLYMREMFGPIAYVIETESTDQSIELAAKCTRQCGAITAALYSTNPDVIEKTIDATAEAGVPLSINLTGQIWVNQSAAFSDFHVSGLNPSGNATLCDLAFVANRFRFVQQRIPVPQQVQPGEREVAGAQS